MILDVKPTRYWYIFEPYKSSFFLTVNLELPNDVACQYASGWLWTIQLNWHQYNKIVFWYSTGLLNRIKRRSTTSQDMVVGIHYINVKSLLIVCSWTYYTNNSIKENCRYYYMSLVWYKTKRIYLLIAIACNQKKILQWH